MNDTARLERGYRRILACYPKAFRQENEEEILAVLLASAGEGRRRAGLAESAALLRGALRMRLRPFGLPPRTVRDAIRLMLFGAISSVAYLTAALAVSGDIKAYRLTLLGHRYTTAQLSHLRPLIIALVIAFGLAEIALWLWLARAASQGRSAARVLSTVLFGLATLGLAGQHGVTQVVPAALTWLTGLAAVWLLWRPASSAYFRSASAARSRAPSHISGP